MRVRMGLAKNNHPVHFCRVITVQYGYVFDNPRGSKPRSMSLNFPQGTPDIVVLTSPDAYSHPIQVRESEWSPLKGQLQALGLYTLDMRAYLCSTPPLEGANDAVLDTSRPVLIEDINALGWRVFTPGATIQGQENFKTLAKSLGYPQPDGFSVDLGRMDHVKQFKAFANKLLLQNTLCTSGLLVMVLSGSYFIDIEDPIHHRWIRLTVTAGDAFSTPAGSFFRYAAKETDIRKVSILLMLRGNDPSMDKFNDCFCASKDGEKHPCRAAYLRSLGR